MHDGAVVIVNDSFFAAFLGESAPVSGLALLMLSTEDNPCTTELAFLFSVSVVRLYFLTAFDLCPVTSHMSYSSTSLSYNRDAALARNEWLVRWPDNPPSLQISDTTFASL